MNGNGRGNASRGRLGLLWAIAVGVHIVAAIVGIRFVREVGYWGVSPFSDVQLYHSYASLIAHGSIPFLHFSLEYPPLAIPCFVVPLLFVEPLANGVDTSAAYIPAFAVEMMLIDAVVVWLLARAVERTAGRAAVPAALGWYTAYFVVLCPLVVARFDLAATLVAFAAATNLDRGRWRVGGVLAGVGVLVKFVPGVVIVPLVAGVAPRDAKIAGVQAMTWGGRGRGGPRSPTWGEHGDGDALVPRRSRHRDRLHLRLSLHAVARTPRDEARHPQRSWLHERDRGGVEAGCPVLDLHPARRSGGGRLAGPPPRAWVFRPPGGDGLPGIHGRRQGYLAAVHDLAHAVRGGLGVGTWAFPHLLRAGRRRSIPGTTLGSAVRSD